MDYIRTLFRELTRRGGASSGEATLRVLLDTLPCAAGGAFAVCRTSGPRGERGLSRKALVGGLMTVVGTRADTLAAAGVEEVPGAGAPLDGRDLCSR